MKKSLFAFAVIALLTVAAVATAQTTTTEIRKGVVVSVYGNNLVVHESGVNREYDVPEGFTFTVDGKKLTVDELKPGMLLTATVTTTTTPQVVQTTQVKHGKVLKVVGNGMIVRTAEGTKHYKNIPSDFVFLVNGQEKSIYEIREGMVLTANIVHESAIEVTQREIDVIGTNAARKAVATEVVKRKAEAYTPPTYLPKTASHLPLTGLAGLLLLAVAAGIALTRRFV